MKHAFAVALLLIGSPVGTAARAPAADDPFSALRALHGSWTGSAEGFGQVAKVTHRWDSIFGDKYFRLSTVSSSEGENGAQAVREDIGYASWIASEKQLRFRHFLSEGFVNTYRIEPVVGDPAGLDFEPESTEGFPDMAARMELRFRGPDAYEMILELGSPGAELKPCQTIRMQRDG